MTQEAIDWLFDLYDWPDPTDTLPTFPAHAMKADNHRTDWAIRLHVDE